MNLLDILHLLGLFDDKCLFYMVHISATSNHLIIYSIRHWSIKLNKINLVLVSSCLLAQLVHSWSSIFYRVYPLSRGRQA